MLSSFAFPTKIVTGAGALSELPGFLAARQIQRPLVVTDPGLLSTPAFAKLKAAVGEGAPVFSAVHGNPLEEDVVAGIEAFRAGECDGVIGFGGGSALDVAKILGLAAQRTDGSWRTLQWDEAVSGLVPFIAIPTTAGTGSEVGRSSVITIEGRKRVLFHPALLAALVILDAELTVGLPPRLTAATGVDALTHCIEAFTSPTFHPLCDAIALEGARLVFQHLAQAVEHGDDVNSRAMMQIAAMMGGIAFQKDLGAAHSLSHPLSARYGLHHGLANGLCLLPVMRLNMERKPGVYQRLAQATGTGSTDDHFLRAVEGLLQRIGVTGGLRDHGVEEAALDELAAAAYADSCHSTNPVPVSQHDLRTLYLEAL